MIFFFVVILWDQKGQKLKKVWLWRHFHLCQIVFPAFKLPVELLLHVHVCTGSAKNSAVLTKVAILPDPGIELRLEQQLVPSTGPAEIWFNWSSQLFCWTKQYPSEFFDPLGSVCTHFNFFIYLGTEILIAY